MRFFAGLLVAFSILFLTSRVTLANAGEERSPRLVVHLLDYLAIDYPAAIQKGKIVDAGEYQEMVEFSKTLLTLVNELPETKGAAGLSEDLEKLKELVHQKADSEVIAKTAGDIKWKIVGVTGVVLSPTVWPNLKRARQSFAANCAACHGAEGRGDGPSGKALDPLPSNFHDGDRMGKMTPSQAYNAIRLGVPGTAMAAFSHFPDAEAWDLAFYVVSLRHAPADADARAKTASVTVSQAATQTDEAFTKSLIGSSEQRAKLLSAIRHREALESDGDQFLAIAKQDLRGSLDDYRNKRFDSSRTKALSAYLNGIEPVEPRLRATDSSLVLDLEEKMGAVRSGIEGRVAEPELSARVEAALSVIGRSESVLSRKASPAVVYSVSLGIVLREAFEAILLVITLLGVTRSIGATRATLFVHGGWLGALLVGLVLWFFSGWVMGISGASREVLEGSIALLAVGVVLYMGFWLHRRTEIGRWRAFLQEMLSSAVSTKRMALLAGISFMAVFREAFETVLFLRAVLLDSGGAHQMAMLAGVGTASVLVAILAVALVHFSARVPIRQLFDISAFVMILLAFMLMGKAVHSFQEAGYLSVHATPIALRVELLGIYPTYESLIPQLIILATSLLLWSSGRKTELRQPKAFAASEK